MALTGRRPAEIFFSASFSLPPRKLPFPALVFDGQLKTRHAPGTSFEPYPIPVLADPKKIIVALDQLRALTRLPPKRLRSYLLPQVQTQKPDRRHLPGPDPRPQAART